MKPERILEIADKWSDYFFDKDYMEDLPEVISKAIHEAIEEENRWYYPEKGELPTNPMGKEFLVITKTNSTRLCWFSLYGDFVILGKEAAIIETENIECWRYVPEVLGGEND